MTNETILDKIYKKYSDLKKEAIEDCKFNGTLIDSSFNNTQLLIKWINKKTEWLRVFRDFEAKRKETYKKTFEFYHSDYPRQLSSKDEYQLFIESDPGYVDIFNQSQVTKEIIQYIDSVIDTLKSKAFLLKDAIKWEMFKNGQ